ncbi:hypothetical protein ACH5RR_009159 [Cinchona calisaya]|uniref:Uncharacterized protein n=1 Tax=Cinchona calisaya TaxID=153742 RepID=A0ABD3AGF6_9GENT
MHKCLKESYARNKKLKIKINALLSFNSKHVHENNLLTKENNALKKRLDVKIKIKEGKYSLNKRLDDLDVLLQKKNENVFEKKKTRNMLNKKKFITIRKDSLYFVKSKYSFYGNKKIIYNYCHQHGLVKNDCYIKQNKKFGMKAIWVIKHATNLIGPKKVWVPKVLALLCV